jgi:hypothetical protein
MRDLVDSDQNTERPAAIFRRNTAICGTIYLFFGSVLVYALLTQSKGLAFVLWATLIIPPMYVWITFAECRRAWRGEPPNETLDTALPMLGFITLAVVLHFSLL